MEGKKKKRKKKKNSLVGYSCTVPGIHDRVIEKLGRGLKVFVSGNGKMVSNSQRKKHRGIPGFARTLWVFHEDAEFWVVGDNEVHPVPCLLKHAGHSPIERRWSLRYPLHMTVSWVQFIGNLFQHHGTRKNSARADPCPLAARVSMSCPPFSRCWSSKCWASRPLHAIRRVPLQVRCSA